MAIEMKDSGIEWIGKIPTDFVVCKLKHILRTHMQYGANESGIEYCESLPRYIRITDITMDGKLKNEGKLSLAHETALSYMLEDGDILFARSGASVGKSFLYKNEYGQAAFAGYLIRAQVRESIVPEFVYYYSCSSAYEIWKNGIFIQSTIQNIGADRFSNMPIVLPASYVEQFQIVDYLDAECAEIDAVLEKTRASIEEYKKLKQAVITQAVTKGIRGDRPMKDSGSMWFGEIPVEWDAKRIKYLFHIKKEIAGAEGHTVLSITQRGVMPKDLSKNEGQIAENYSNYQLVNPGDFAMNHMDLLTGWVDISKYSGVTSPDYRVFVLDDAKNNDREYYLYMMQMCYFNRIFYGLGAGVSGMGRWRLQADKFLNFIVAVPPAEEQREISEHLDTQCKELNSLIEKKEQFLSELESYKKSLIFEYVTGKKEVV